MGIRCLRRAVFLDRDGVLNQAIIKNGKPYPPAHTEELMIPSDVQAGLQRLKLAGFLLIGATNQPDVARGKTDKKIVEAINTALMQQLPLDEITVCYHDDQDQCQCRKPLPGLLLEAAKKHGIDLKKSFMVGDRWKDIEAGRRAGVKTIWIDCGYAEQPASGQDCTVSSFAAAAEWMIRTGENP